MVTHAFALLVFVKDKHDKFSGTDDKAVTTTPTAEICRRRMGMSLSFGDGYDYDRSSHYMTTSMSTRERR